jgi:hypothetical protein
MKTFQITGIALLFSMICSAGIKITISNPNQTDLKDAPVVVKLNEFKKIPLKKRQNLAVFINNKQVSSQLDDLNNDSIADELIFLTDLKAGESKKVLLNTISDKKRIKFPAEVYTSLIIKDGDAKKYVREVSSTKNDMYNKLHHHGVAFESAQMAYRIYFDNKSTIDLYGKKKYQLELADTEWYPTDEQLAKGYGDDILLVSGWVGAGTVKGWDGKKATHIDNFQQRTHRIVASGNLRIVAESDVKGWEYEGKKVDMKVRYILYARHRDMIAEVTVSSDVKMLATGVQQIGGGALFQSNQLLGSWGSWYPQPDTVKYKKETVGLGLYMPLKYEGKQVLDGVNNLIIAPCKAGETLRFHVTAIAAKEEGQTVQSDKDFFRYLDGWRKGLENISVK